jgi:hypothetical protein
MSRIRTDTKLFEKVSSEELVKHAQAKDQHAQAKDQHEPENPDGSSK